MKTIYLGAGGFWTTEAIYKRVKGVYEVIPGYMGGTVEYPTHEVVATGATGHAEVVQIIYDDTVVPIEQMLRLFFALHDASAPAHTMHGVGSQYRSVIFYTDDADGEATQEDNGEHVGSIQHVIEEVSPALPEGVSIATQIMTAQTFYPADETHYNYYDQHPDDTYSVTVIAPKLQEVQRRFPDMFL